MRRHPGFLLFLAFAASGCGLAPRGVAPDDEIGRSREGRPVLARTLGAGEPRVYLIGGIHGNEREGAPLAASVAQEVEKGGLGGSWRILCDLNPDGSARGTRGNARGIDLNRNWPASNFALARDHGPRPLSEPECAAVHQDLLAFAPDLVLVFHSTEDGPFINYDGPAAELAAAFAHASGWPVQAELGYPTPGSLGSWIGKDLGIPILTLEFRRGDASAQAQEAVLRGLMALQQLRPEPAEGAGGDEAVDQAVEDELGGRAPALALPDALGHDADAVGEERDGAGDAEDQEVGRVRRKAVVGGVGHEDADHDREQEPLHQVLAHVHRTGRPEHQDPDGPALEFGLHLRRLALLHRAGIGEHVLSRLHALIAQHVENLAFAGYPFPVRFVHGERHVEDRAGDEDEDCRQQDGQPKFGQELHFYLPMAG
ncbi:MAG: hypothetical protein EYC70_00885 [Planctomycetota bacterium]|nr:MAG: hypothetical protein EYC70_00885 [Planctomycetota bacterium]